MKMNKSTDLKRIQDFVTRLKSTNATNNKIDIIKEYKEDHDIKEVLKYTYSPFKQYHVTSKNCKKNSDLTKYGYTNLFCLLRDLNSRLLTGHEAIS